MKAKKSSPKSSSYVKTIVKKGVPLKVAQRWEARKKSNATKKGKK